MTGRRYVGVVGPGAGASAEQVAQAIEVGRLLAERGWVVVTGGLGGVMAGAARGCADAGGTSLGLLPGDDRDQADPHLTLAVPTGLGEMRNALLVRTCDAVVGIGHSWGTLSEIALACRTGVPVVLLDAPDLFGELPRDEGGAAPLRATGPDDAVRLVADLLGPAVDASRTAVPAGHVLGVDATPGGWVGALLPAAGEGEVVLVAAPDIATLVERPGRRPRSSRSPSTPRSGCRTPGAGRRTCSHGRGWVGGGARSSPRRCGTRSPRRPMPRRAR